MIGANAAPLCAGFKIQTHLTNAFNYSSSSGSRTTGMNTLRQNAAASVSPDANFNRTLSQDRPLEVSKERFSRGYDGDVF